MPMNDRAALIARLEALNEVALMILDGDLHAQRRFAGDPKIKALTQGQRIRGAQNVLRLEVTR